MRPGSTPEDFVAEDGFAFPNATVFKFWSSNRVEYQDEPDFDSDGDVELFWYEDEERFNAEDSMDSAFIGNSDRICFLMDDGQIVVFRSGNDNDFDYQMDDNGRPTGKYREMLDFLMDHLKADPADGLETFDDDDLLDI